MEKVVFSSRPALTLQRFLLILCGSLRGIFRAGKIII